ncbi:metal-sensing transcriptional repressor [Erysipelothrix urinaevulpis]|uniref:metal-sensing transcriptional repressor n=1 Tax=Erysipelothrix urinaevulpis TaxID=2683717 RepID=UPI00135B538E|nr:metal-sensing transcriptional repressor [Erysipelothrix urinaevulpis]
MICNKDLRNRLSRTEGQVRGIIKMLDNDAACQDVLTQLMAVRSSVEKVISLVAVNNLMETMESPETSDKLVEDAVNLLVRSR